MSGVIIQVSLLSGRYHAHPWGEAQHAMAGPEWPPSPWRLLRGLAAAWFNANPRPVTEEERDDLLQALGRAPPPVMWLPSVSFAEIPYYQPIVDKNDKRQKRVLHFDHFAVLSEGDGGACFCFDFDVDLSARQQSVLALLLARLTYFGRAESRARLCLVGTPCKNLYKAIPANGHSLSHEVRRRVLVTRLDTFCASDLWGAKPGKGHLVQEMIEERRKRPPNTDWIDYALPAGARPSQLARRPVAASEEMRRVATVRFGLFRRIPIRLPELVRVAREIRDRAAANFKDSTGASSRRLTGREGNGAVAKGHRHAFWLPEPDRGCLRHCTVWLPDGTDGIDPRELDALLGVRRVFCDDDYPILVVVEHVTDTCPEPTPSRRWRSLTPFLPPPHSHRGRRELKPSEQLQRMVKETTGASPTVTATSGPGTLGRLTTVRAHLYQRGTWRWTKRTASWFELEFDHPVILPRPVGADAHFGLGQFVPL